MSFRPTYADREASVSSRESRIAFAVVAVILTYLLLSFLDVLPDTFDRAVWEAFVRVTPSRVVYFWERIASRHGSPEVQRFTKEQSGDLHAKSEALKRLLGLDRHRLLTTFQRARSLSGIGKMFSATRSDVPPGLGNWDNSCYQNSVIQGFASLPSVENFICNNLRTTGANEGFVTHRALKTVISDLNATENCGRRIWTPTDLKSMSSWQQQDAQEYFSKIVDEMDKEATRARRRSSDPGLNATEPLEPVSGSLRNPLEGLVAQRVGCMQCAYSEGLSLIPFNCLTVPLGRSWEYDIRDCLDEYTALEPIEGVECAKCTLQKVKDQLERLVHQFGEAEDSVLKDWPDNQSSPQSPSPKNITRNEYQAKPQMDTKSSSGFQTSVKDRLVAVTSALDQNDFSENALSKKCNIPGRNRVSVTKSRQAVIAKPPKSLVIHVNRSLFDETTGAQRKNYADVRFPATLDLDDWCLGAPCYDEGSSEDWTMDPSKSMLSAETVDVTGDHQHDLKRAAPGQMQRAEYLYRLRAVVTHVGRHENGHYITYRKRPRPIAANDYQQQTTSSAVEGDEKTPEQWFRFSDDDVSVVDESQVLSQGGVFMLFYELSEQSAVPSIANISSLTETTCDHLGVERAPNSLKAENADIVASVSGFSVSDDHFYDSIENVARPTTPEVKHIGDSKQAPTAPVMRTSGATKQRCSNFLPSTPVVPAL